MLAILCSGAAAFQSTRTCYGQPICPRTITRATCETLMRAKKLKSNCSLCLLSFTPLQSTSIQDGRHAQREPDQRWNFQFVCLHSKEINQAACWKRFSIFNVFKPKNAEALSLTTNKSLDVINDDHFLGEEEIIHMISFKFVQSLDIKSETRGRLPQFASNFNDAAYLLVASLHLNFFAPYSKQSHHHRPHSVKREMGSLDKI